MKTKKAYFTAACCGLLAVLLVILVRCVDTAPVGPESTVIGLSHLNQAVHDMTGVHMLWYDITDWLGIAAILVAALFALTGFIQMIRRKGLLKVDREILVLGGLYVVVIALYIFFEIAIVNYRPVIMPGSEHPEASFPSSHTMLVCVVLGSAMALLHKYIKGNALCVVLEIVCGLVIAVTVIGRLISGVHWFTDIIGGLLISACLLALFSALAGTGGKKPEVKDT